MIRALTVGNKKIDMHGSTIVREWIPPKYAINITQVEGCTITSNYEEAESGTLVTLSYTTDTGYLLQNFTLNGTAIVGNSFTMPAEDATISAVVEAATLPSRQIGNRIWATNDLDIDDGGSGILKSGGITFYSYAAAERIASQYPGWRIPTQEDWRDLIKTIVPSATGSTQRFVASALYGLGGIGFNLKPDGFYYNYTANPRYNMHYNSGNNDLGPYHVQPGTYGTYMPNFFNYHGNAWSSQIVTYPNTSIQYSDPAAYPFVYTTRLCKDV